MKHLIIKLVVLIGIFSSINAMRDVSKSRKSSFILPIARTYFNMVKRGFFLRSTPLNKQQERYLIEQQKNILKLENSPIWRVTHLGVILPGTGARTIIQTYNGSMHFVVIPLPKKK